MGLIGGKGDPGGGMMEGREDHICQGVESHHQRSGIDAGVACEHRTLAKVFINQKRDLVVDVVDQPHRSDRTGRNSQKTEHVVRGGERESGRAYLRREVFGFEDLVARHQQEVETSLLFVGQEKIFKDRGLDEIANLIALFNCEGFRMFEGFIIYLEGVEKIIDFILHVGTRRGGRASVEKFII